MRYSPLFFVVVALALPSAACKQKAAPPPVPARAQPSRTAGSAEKPPKTAPGLPEDKAFSGGKVPIVRVDLKTRLEIPGSAPAAGDSEEIKKAKRASALSQTFFISEERSKLLFDSADFYLPQGTELRHSPSMELYLLVDPREQLYWTLRGEEVGSLMEGGPATTRSDYTITIAPPAKGEPAPILEYPVRLTEATVSFRWTLKLKDGQRSGKTRVKLSIWHTDVEVFKPDWWLSLLDFLTLPFQDEAGDKVVAELKKNVSFPLKWIMEVKTEGQGHREGEAPLRLVSEAIAVEMTELDRQELALPPRGYRASAEPYRFGAGGQTASPSLLGQLPARKGDPPKNLEKPE